MKVKVSIVRMEIFLKVSCMILIFFSLKKCLVEELEVNLVYGIIEGVDVFYLVIILNEVFLVLFVGVVKIVVYIYVVGVFGFYIVYLFV